MTNDLTHQKLAEYIQMELDGSLSDEQFADMASILKSSARARRYYARTITMVSLFRDGMSLNPVQAEAPDSQEAFDCAMWNALSLDEKVAEPVILPPSTQPVELVTDVRQRKAMLRTGPRKIPVSLWISLGSLAAVVMLVAYIVFRPNILSQPVATVVDTIDAKWEVPMDTGDRLYDKSSEYVLLSGYAKIRFDYGVEVIVEGPSLFTCPTAETLQLAYGKVHVEVPSQMAGFSVDTPSSKIIDLGTEFGVLVASHGFTDVHMLKGKAAVIPGSKGHKSTALNIETGQATRVDANGQMQTIPFESTQFVRQIDSRNRFISGGMQVHPADGLIIHLKADSLLLGDGAPVTAWPDSAQADAVDGTVRQLPGFGVPVFRADAHNGLPSIRFTRPEVVWKAAGYQKQVLVSDSWDWDASQGLTIFIFCTGGIAEKEQRVIQVGNVLGEATRSFGCDVCSLQSGSRDNNGWCLADSPFAYGDWHISVRQIAQGGQYDSLFYAVDGLDPLTVSTNRPGRFFQFDASNNHISVGNGRLKSGWTGDWYDGDIAEVLVYNRQLSRQEMQSVLNYLEAKYAHTPSRSGRESDAAAGE